MDDSTMSPEAYADMVAVATYAIQRGYQVEMVAAGDLLLRPRQEKEGSVCLSITLQMS